jgi:hypothetical protein
VINGWYSKQIDYVLAFPQADYETDNLFMSILKGFEMKQGSRVWHQNLNKKLEVAGLKQSQIDDCIYNYYKKLIYILYMDDSILVGPDEQEVVEITNRIQAAKVQSKTSLGLESKGTNAKEQ